MTAWLRAGLALMVLWQVGAALWAAVLPADFYRSFPLPAHAWVALFPPYNEHLTRDYGLALLQLAPAAALCARRPEPAFVRAVLVGSLLFHVPHGIFHEAHVVRTDDLVLQRLSLWLPVVLALVLLHLNRRASAPRRPGGAGGPPAG